MKFKTFTNNITIKLPIILMIAFFSFLNHAYAVDIQEPSNFVPVNDNELNTQFYEFHEDFDDYTENFNDYRHNFYDYWEYMLHMIETDEDSLKNLIAGEDPGNIAMEECGRVEIPYDEYGIYYEIGLAHTLDPDTLPTNEVVERIGEFLAINPDQTDVTVNDSASLRCLLQELVEWRKLNLNLTIHTMMKNFITDAQAFLFTKQMQTYIVAGLIDWSEIGTVLQLSDTDTVNTSAYTANKEAQINNRVSSIRGGIIANIEGEDGGFTAFDIYEPFRQSVKNSFTKNTLEAQTIDIEMLSSSVANTVYDVFPDEQAVIDTLSGDSFSWDRYKNLILSSNNNPLSIQDIIENNLRSQIKQMEVDQYSTMKNGVLDSTICIDSEDPWCHIQQIVTPASINRETLSHTMEAVGGSALTKTDEQNEKPGEDTQEFQTQIVDVESLRDYDTTDLRMKSPDFNALYVEFFNEIMFGYYDIDPNVVVWGQNSLTSITDELYYQMIIMNQGTYGPEYGDE